MTHNRHLRYRLTVIFRWLSIKCPLYLESIRSMKVVLSHTEKSWVIPDTFSGSSCGFSSRVYGSLTMTLTAGGVGMAFRVQSFSALASLSSARSVSSRVTSSNVLTHCQRRCQWPGLYIGTTEIHRGSFANPRQDTSSLGTRGYVELQNSKVLKRELLLFGSVLQSIYGDHAVRHWHSKARNSTDDGTIRYEVLLRWAELSQAFPAEIK